MMQRDDFENRLGQGLKRWAESGKPSLDLQAHVLGQTDPTAPPTLAAHPSGDRRWLRWLTVAAAAAALALTAGLSFPVWAGAAAQWPLVGPVVKEIIFKDAGLKWAYDMGLIEGTMAEERDGDVGFRILGVLADSRRTLVMYQVTGLPPKRPFDGKPIRATEGVPPANSETPSVAISKVNGKGGMSSSGQPVQTPLGLFGTVSTLPLETESAELEVSLRARGKTLSVLVTASRGGTDSFSREVAVDRTVEIDGVKVTVEAVIYTPAETVIRYRTERAGPVYAGPLSWDGETESAYMESGGKRLRVSGSGIGVDNLFHAVYPPVDGPVQWVVPVDYRAVAVDLTWPLQKGAVQEVLGVPVTLADWEVTGQVISLTWESLTDPRLLSFSGFEAVDASGATHRLGRTWSGDGSNAHSGKLIRTHQSELPLGFVAVAVRSTTAAVKVTGPWVFELPR